MRIIIDKKLVLKIQSESPTYTDKNTLLIFGTLFGSFDGEKIYDRKGTIQKLKDNREDFFEFVNYIVGKIIIIIRRDNNLHIICSKSSSGFYYFFSGNNLIISDEEEYIYKKYSLAELDNEVVFYKIFNYWQKLPFDSFIKDVNRVSAGCMISIDRNLSVKLKIYILRKNGKIDTINSLNDNGKFKLLIKSIESTASIIANNSHKDIYIMLSGIDSISFLIAFSKVTDKKRLHPIRIDDCCGDGNKARLICRKLGLKLINLPFWDGKMPRLEKEKTFYSTPFSNNYSSILPSLSNYFKRKQIKNPIVITGNNMDGMYTISTYDTSGEIFLLYPILKIAKRQWKYSFFFYSFILKFPFNWLLNIFNKQEFYQINKYDYLLSTICSSSSLPYEVDKRYEKYNLKFNDYIKYKKKRFLDKFLEYTDIDMNRENINYSYLNHILRTLLFLNTAASSPIKTINTEGPYEYIQPAVEGFISDYFLKFQPSIKDVFFIKRYLYKYFKNNFRKNYISYVFSANTGYPLSKSGIFFRFEYLISRIIQIIRNKLINYREKGLEINMWDLLDIQAENVRKYLLIKYKEKGKMEFTAFKKKEHAFIISMLEKLKNGEFIKIRCKNNPSYAIGIRRLIEMIIFTGMIIRKLKRNTIKNFYQAV